MQMEFSREHEAFRRELREYFEALMTSEMRAGLGIEGGPRFREAMRQLGADGWFGISLPTEWGGRDATVIEELIFNEEALRVGLPIPHITTSTVGPLILQHGTEEQKERFVSGISSGDTMFSIGYSEEGAGTDLASLQTTAVRDGDEWVINGQKLYTSAVSEAQYVWLAARTNPDPAARHRGISVFMVPTDAPGFSWTPIDIIADYATAASYYDNVRIPANNLIGELNGGWKLVTGQLNRERVVLFTGAAVPAVLEHAVQWATETRLPDGRRVVDQEWVRTALGEVRAKSEFGRLLALKLALDIEEDRLDAAGAAANKVYATEHVLDCYRTLLEIFGAAGRHREGSAGAELSGRIELLYRGGLIELFGGGANDVMRDFISTLGLGLPRSR